MVLLLEAGAAYLIKQAPCLHGSIVSYPVLHIWNARLNKTTPGWCEQQCCSCCICAAPCRAKPLAGVRSSTTVVVRVLHRTGTELFEGFHPLPPPHPPPCSVLLFVGVRWLGWCRIKILPLHESRVPAGIYCRKPR